MYLTPQQHRALAVRACWYFDLKPGSAFDRGDRFVLTGQGLRDLNQVLEFGRRYPTGEIVCEIGTQGTVLLGNAFPKYSRIGVDDVDAIKTAYLEYWGSVDRPPVDPRPAPYGTYTVTVYPAAGAQVGQFVGTLQVEVGAARQLGVTGSA